MPIEAVPASDMTKLQSVPLFHSSGILRIHAILYLLKGTMGRFGSSRGRGFPGRIAPGLRPVTETCRMSIAEQLEEFQKSDETSAFYSIIQIAALSCFANMFSPAHMSIVFDCH